MRLGGIDGTIGEDELAVETTEFDVEFGWVLAGEGLCPYSATIRPGLSVIRVFSSDCPWWKRVSSPSKAEETQRPSSMVRSSRTVQARAACSLACWTGPMSWMGHQNCEKVLVS